MKNLFPYIKTSFDFSQAETDQIISCFELMEVKKKDFFLKSGQFCKHVAFVEKGSFNDEALKLTRKETFEVNEDMSIGLAWHLLKQKGGNVWHWHNGATGGYTSSMTLDVENSQGVIVLSNISAFHSRSSKIDDLCFELMHLD